MSVPVQNIGGSLVANQNECAAACQADPECNAASYYLDPSAYGDRNCFTKTLSIPCELPPDAPSVDGAVLLLQTTECMPLTHMWNGRCALSTSRVQCAAECNVQNVTSPVVSRLV